MNCKTPIEVLMHGDELDAEMRHHVDTCDACRGHVALMKQLHEAGEAARQTDLDEAALGRTREKAIALLNETAEAPALPWSRWPVTVSGSAIAAIVVLIVMAAQFVINPDKDVDTVANVKPLIPAVEPVDIAGLDQDFESIRESLEQQITGFVARHDVTSGPDQYAARVDDLSREMRIMARELQGELTTYIP